MSQIDPFFSQCGAHVLSIIRVTSSEYLLRSNYIQYQVCFLVIEFGPKMVVGDFRLRLQFRTESSIERMLENLDYIGHLNNYP